MKILPLIILTTSIAIAGIAHAKSHNPEKIVSRVTEKLSLNETQQNHFRAFIDEKQALRTEHREKRENRKQQRKEGEKKPNDMKHDGTGPFASIFEKETISVDDINQAMDTMHAKKKERRQKVITTFVTFINSLDDQQREQAKPMLHKMLKGSKGGRRKEGGNHMKKYSTQG